jgi:hypothetical protein
VVPVIAALRQQEATAQLPLSVDTFYADVAAAAVQAGATMVNDVSGGTMDSRMHRQVTSRKAWVATTGGEGSLCCAGAAWGQLEVPKACWLLAFALADVLDCRCCCCTCEGTSPCETAFRYLSGHSALAVYLPSAPSPNRHRHYRRLAAPNQHR